MKRAIRRYLLLNFRSLHAFGAAWRRRLTPSGTMALPGLLLAAVIGVDTTTTLAYQAFALLGAVGIAAWAFSRLQRPRLEVRRSPPRHASVGVTASCRLDLRNPGRHARAGLLLRESWPDPRPTLEEFRAHREPGEERRNWFDRRMGYYRWAWLVDRNRRADSPVTAVPRLAPGASASVDVPFTPRRRGPLHFEAVEVLCPDPFGLMYGIRVQSAAGRVMVLPRRYPVPATAMPGAMQYQPGGVALASSVGESEEFVSVRDYRPGDPRRHIHWRSWARAGRPIVREFQNEYFVRHALVLDTFAGPELDAVFEEAVSVAASFACTLPAQDSLLDLLFVGTRAFCFTAGRGLAHTEHLLEIIASVERCEDQPFSALTDLVRDHVAHVSGCICVLLGWDEERRKLAGLLRKSGVPTRVYVVRAPGDRAPLDAGPLGDDPGALRALECGRIAEGLAAP